MARFSLRNQNKIEKTFGYDFLQCLLSSLKKTFEINIIEEHTYENEKYKIIHSHNVQKNSDSFFELYIISKTYDVFNLAYKSTCG